MNLLASIRKGKTLKKAPTGIKRTFAQAETGLMAAIRGYKASNLKKRCKPAWCMPTKQQEGRTQKQENNKTENSTNAKDTDGDSSASWASKDSASDSESEVHVDTCNTNLSPQLQLVV